MSLLVEAHSLLRWLVLLLAVTALLVALLDARGRLQAAVRGAVIAYATVMTVQLLLGLALWVGESRWDGENAFFSWIHPAAMLLAVGAAHAGMARVRRAGSAPGARRAVLLFTVVSLVLVLLAIPW